ncbi:thiamine pyrophosphate-dependent enzyme [Paracrocinitomix mangrovi]|uniref:alpha-ketoacid dehydrogenase subunit alpha/beta n=1 Tax=Paracrocinitomix mangrovi TaxID=2862509 RepID=UPI001C8D7109|nr:alpha-ketoacid dehydrogenase subunit alpha/beta [Paracrocinitomix mangrovi]UKN02620.1 thiamine pyrophosphate-dependent enzyme [Paracrocinitomix mangrovi]
MAEQEEVLNATDKKYITEVLEDYKLARISREASLMGRREVLGGKAKFGIFGDGKELAQIAMAKQFKNGDFRSGYYRDQTFMMAIGALTVKEYFAALYAHTDPEKEPASAGRQMGGHYSTRSLNPDGSWKNLMEQKNSSADISPTAGQMPRLVGLALASKVYRQNKDLHKMTNFTNKGNEVAFGTIGDASTSEGPFWESINAAGVLQIPFAISIWDDGYGISVPKKYQTTKGSISEALSGMQRSKKSTGYEIFKTKGWDYAHLCETYEKAIKLCRDEHVPVMIHVEEVNQPQGHSTSGSHERYKSEERLQWETDMDCIEKFREFILDAEIATAEELENIDKEAKKHVRDQKGEAWKEFNALISDDLNKAVELMNAMAKGSANAVFIEKVAKDLKDTMGPIKRDIFAATYKALRYMRGEESPAKTQMIAWLKDKEAENWDMYSSYLHSESESCALNIEGVAPVYEGDELTDGRIILRDNFDKVFESRPEVLTFGEDVGKIGGVNQSMEGMQEKFGELRVSDTGIRECTIIGQGIGMAMRGLRPIAEIQYLDYLLYAIQILSDDLATVQYRTKGGQKAPLIIRTRGHRLEGIWHSGSPMGMIINALRGMYVCVPRNMTKAAGMYNTLLASDEPALVVECLNGYRKKEKVPANYGEFMEPLGKVEVVKEGTDVTVVSYGSTFAICEEVAQSLEEVGVSVELIDVQTLIPFDLDHDIVKSIAKTNKLVIVDEDVSSGATAYMLDQIMVKQEAYYHLDSKPVTISARDHRPAYGTDGDYFSKPNFESIFNGIYNVMSEVDPQQYPRIM